MKKSVGENILSRSSIISKPTTVKILSFINNSEINIFDLKKKLGMAYNNTFANVKKMEAAGLIKIEKTNQQNNPSKIISLTSDPINLFSEKEKLKNITEIEKDNIVKSYVLINCNMDLTLVGLDKIIRELSKYLNPDVDIEIDTNLIRGNKKFEVLCRFIFKEPLKK